MPRLILTELGEPIMSSTLMLPGDEQPLTDAREIQERLLHVVDAVIDGGNCGLEPTSVIDLEGPAPVVARRARATSAPSNEWAGGIGRRPRYFGQSSCV